MTEDAKEAQREATASGPLGGGSRGPPCRAYCSEDKEDNQGQDKRESWEVKACRRGRKKKADEVLVEDTVLLEEY